MDLMDLYEKNQQEIERFKILRDKVWQQVLTDNQNLAAAFGGKDRLDEDAQKAYYSRINAFNAEWSMEGGSRYNDMLDQHEKQIRQITGQKNKAEQPDEQQTQPRKEKSDATTKEEFVNQGDRITDKDAGMHSSNENDEAERQALRDKIAKQQAAIKARKAQKKRGR